MYVEIEVPEIKEFPKGFPQYWLHYIFGNRLTETYQVSSLISTFVRLVEASLTEYRLGAKALNEYWNTHESINLGAMWRSTSHFETCVSDMHRAIECFRRLRRHADLPDQLRDLFREKRPRFIAAHVGDQIRDFRNEVHHTHDSLIAGIISQGQPVAAKPDGPEVPHPTEANQTIKTIDRISLGEYEILFFDLASWLKEMAGMAESIANLEPPKE